MTQIFINLTGDYAIQGGQTQTVEAAKLHELDAFLGALRGTANSDPDAFLAGLSKAINLVKAGTNQELVLCIDSTLVDFVLTHTFRLSIAKACTSDSA